MAAPKGNKFWMLASSYGRNPKFATPEDLWKAACEYFEWVDDNPLKEDRPFAYQGVVVHEPVNKMRAMTLKALHLFIDISNSTWINYKAKEDFLTITRKIEDIIYSQKLEGAAAELLNANIIARELGLSEKKEISGDVNISRIKWVGDE